MVSNARGTGTWTNVKFPPTQDLICVKCPGVARGGMGTFGFDSYIRMINLKLVTGNSSYELQNLYQKVGSQI